MTVPDVDVNVTVCPDTGFEAAFSTRTFGSTTKLAPGSTNWLSATTAASFTTDAATIAPVAVKVAESAPAVAVSVFGPGAVPSVHDPTVAIPSALVTALSPVALPPPLATAKTTVTPGNGSSIAPSTITLGATATAVPAGALWRSPAFGKRKDGGTAPTVIVADVAGVRPTLPN